MLTVKELGDFPGAEGVDHVFFLEPSLAGNPDAVAHLRETVNIVCVRVDAYFDAFFLRILAPPPVEVEPEGVRIDFNYFSEVRRGIDHLYHVHGVPFAFQKEPAGGGAEHGHIFVFDGLDDPDRKSTRLNSSHVSESRMPSSA